jgi:hypothetical protein
VFLASLKRISIAKRPPHLLSTAHARTGAPRHAAEWALPRPAGGPAQRDPSAPIPTTRGGVDNIVTFVPEPGTLSLFGLGLAVLILARPRSRRA